MQVTDFISEVYTPRYIKTATRKASQYIDVTLELTNEIILLLASVLPKIRTYVKGLLDTYGYSKLHQEISIRFRNTRPNSDSVTEVRRNGCGEREHGISDESNSLALVEVRGQAVCDKPLSSEGEQRIDETSNQEDSELDQQFQSLIHQCTREAERGVHEFAERSKERLNAAGERSRAFAERSTERLNAAGERLNYVCNLSIGLIDYVKSAIGTDVELTDGSSKDRILEASEQKVIEVKAEPV